MKCLEKCKVTTEELLTCKWLARQDGIVPGAISTFAFQRVKTMWPFVVQKLAWSREKQFAFCCMHIEGLILRKFEFYLCHRGLMKSRDILTFRERERERERKRKRERELRRGSVIPPPKKRKSFVEQNSNRYFF